VKSRQGNCSQWRENDAYPGKDGAFRPDGCEIFAEIFNLAITGRFA
jgi:hypothetical protein